MNILIVATAVLFPSCCTHDLPSISLRFYQHRSCKATGASTKTLPDTVMTFQLWPTEHAIHTYQAGTSTILWALVPMRTPNVYECAFSVEFTLPSSYPRTAVTLSTAVVGITKMHRWHVLIQCSWMKTPGVGSKARFICFFHTSPLSAACNRRYRYLGRPRHGLQQLLPMGIADNLPRKEPRNACNFLPAFNA